MTAPTPQEIEALLARVPEGFTPGPWQPCFHLRSLENDASCPCGYRGGIWGNEQVIVCEMGPDNTGEGHEMNPRSPRSVQLKDATLIALAPDLASALRALAEERDRRDAIVAETVQMLAELRAKLDAAAEARDAKLASIEAGVTALAEERDRLASENARLRRALEPFGAAAAAYDPVEADDAEEAFVTRFTLGLLRAARAALAEPPHA